MSGQEWQAIDVNAMRKFAEEEDAPSPVVVTTEQAPVIDSAPLPLNPLPVMNQAYTDLKPAWHLDRIKSLRETGRCVPAQIQLVISDLCNQSCSFCAYRMEGYESNQHFADETGNNNPNRMIPYEKCIEILDDARSMGVEAVQFTGGGEPTVHPRHLDVFRHALSIGLRCSLVTNGNRLLDGWESALSQFEWVRVSLDAGTPDTYSSIRKVKRDFFAKTIANVQRMALAGVKNLGVSFIVTKENAGECYEAASHTAHAGAASIRFAAIFTPQLLGYYADSSIVNLAVADIARAARDFSSPTFAVIDMLGQRLGDLEQGTPDYEKCGYQHFNVYIGGDQNVYRCCNTAYNDLGMIGSLQEQGFRAFWESEATDALYLDFKASSCAHCAFNGKNRLISYLTGPAPDHVSFV